MTASPLPSLLLQPASAFLRWVSRRVRSTRHFLPATLLTGMLTGILAGILAGILTGMPAATTWGQPPVHYLQSGLEPPGSVASVQRLRGGPVAGYFQPVEIRGPGGSLISIAHDGGFTSPESNQLHAALVVGELYRIRIGNIPLYEEAEVYPTIEMLNRLYPPEGQKLRFPIPIVITQEELQMAISGQLVTRVIYLEDPQLAYPESQTGNEQRLTPISPDSDPLQEADRRGRPMVILRMGSRVPDVDHATGENLFPTPPFIVYTPPPLPSPMSRDEADRGLERELEPRDYPRLPLDPTPEAFQDSRREEDLPPIVSRDEGTFPRTGPIQSRLPQPDIQRR